MQSRWLLYDGGCEACAALARAVEALSEGRLGVRSLRDPEVQGWLDQARPGWRWEPMLMEVTGEGVQIFAGWEMRVRLVQVLGPVRAWRVARAVARLGGPVLGVDWGRRRLLQQGAVLAGLALVNRLMGWPRTLGVGTDNALSTPSDTGAIEVWEGFVLLPEGAPVPSFVTCAPAPVLCQTDGAPDAEALRGEVQALQGLQEARAYQWIPLYQPIGYPFRHGIVIRFQESGQVFCLMLDFGVGEQQVSLWARPIYPQPFPVWPVRRPDQPEDLIKPMKISFTPAPGLLLPTVSGYMVHWIENNVLYTLIIHRDSDGSLTYKIANSLQRL